MQKLIVGSLSLAVAALAGCGGGSSYSPSTATGVFKDSNVSGLSYVSGGQSGVTDANGQFTYEVGSTVTFSIGGVTIGTAGGSEVITPIDLVSNGSSTSTAVTNIVMFLMMLDRDGNPDNGITISSQVQTVAEQWSDLNFATLTPSTAYINYASDAASADGGTHAVPTATAAQQHIEATHRCAYAGAYAGTFSGDDMGNFGIVVDASTGDVTGIAYSTLYSQQMTLSASSPITADQDAAFVSGSVSTGATFTGQFNSVNSLSGTWSLAPDTGSFSGSRVGGSSAAVYRFTGQYVGDDFGMFTMDVDNNNDITGLSYSIIDDSTMSFTGTLNGTTVVMTSSDNSVVVSGSLSTATGSLSGSWSNSVDGLTGSFSGGGCRLN